MPLAAELNQAGTQWYTYGGSTSKSGSDTAVVAISESSLLAFMFSAADALSIATTDATVSLAVSLSRADSPTVSVTQSSASALSSSRTDSISLAISEASALFAFVTKAGADAIAVALAQASSVVQTARAFSHNLILWASTVFYGKRRQ